MAIQEYINSITNKNTLTKEEQDKLARIIKESKDEKEIALAKEKLIEGNLFLVVDCAKNFKTYSSANNLMDLISAGNVALMTAVNKYNIDNETKASFATYAYVTIRNSMYREVVSNKRIHIPENCFLYIKKIKDVMKKYGEDVSDDFIIKKLDITKEKLKTLKKVMEQKFIFLDQTYDSNNTIQLDLEKEETFSFDGLDEEILHSKLLKAIDKLSEKQKRVIMALYFGKGETITELAKKYKCSRQNVSYTKYNALRKLKTILNKKEFVEYL